MTVPHGHQFLQVGALLYLSCGGREIAAHEEFVDHDQFRRAGGLAQGSSFSVLS